MLGEGWDTYRTLPIHLGVMFLQPIVMALVAGHDLIQFVPKGGGVVGMNEMGQLVDHDVVEHVDGGHGALPVKIEVAAGSAGSPAVA